MRELRNTEIAEMLKKDSVGRNGQLNLIMKFINSFEDNTVVSIDGRWGTGKTVFVKQLKLLADTGDEALPDYGDQISRIDLAEFQRLHSVYYFNAWEHDYLTDPLEALLYRLINDFSDTESAALAKKVSSKVDLTGFIKNITKDAIDLDAKTTDEQLVMKITKLVDRKDAVKSLLDGYIETSGKKLLFIIDELDRCRPSFAVELLEVIKHYYDSEHIIFLLATNQSELSHTVQKYYGGSFDSSRYLNKFFDYSVELQPVDIEKYITAWHGIKNDGYFRNSIAHDIATLLDLTMRGINSFFTSLKLLDGYMNRNNHWEPGAQTWLTQVVYVPLALALKMTHDPRYQPFRNGEGRDLLNNLCVHSTSVMHLAAKVHDDKTDQSDAVLTQLILDNYAALFSPLKGDYKGRKLQNESKAALSLISSYSSIPSKKDSEQ